MVKARCSTGYTVTEYFGSFGLKESVDFQIPSMDADKSFGFQLRNDEKIAADKTVYVQIAVLYTNAYAERRIRVFNTAYQVTTSLNTYFKACIAESYV